MLLANSGEVAALVGSIGAVVVIGGGITLLNCLRVITEYERAVIFRFGHLRGEAKGPGVIVKFPFADRLVKVNLRTEVIDIPPQGVITADNVTVQVDAVAYFQVTDPVQAVVGVDNFRFASQRVAMTALRSIIGRHQLDAILAHRDDLNNELRATIATSTHNWGVEVRQVEIRDIALSPELLRAMARQAEAERERRAKVISATGELESSKELAEAAAKLHMSPGAMQLRTLQTLAEIATGQTTTLVFPIPVELLGGLQGLASAVPSILSQTAAAPAVAPEETPELTESSDPVA